MNQKKILVGFLSVFVLVLFPFLSRSATISFPSSGWYALKSNGVDIADSLSDATATNSRNIVGDASNPSVYVNSDADYLYFRIRVDKTPYSSSSSEPDVIPMFAAFGWAVAIDTDYDFTDFETLVILSGQKELVYHLENTTPSGTGNVNDTPENVRHSASTADVAQYSTAGSALNGTADFFVDFAVSWASLGDSINTFPIESGQNLRFVVATSGNNNNRIRETDPDYASPYVIPATEAGTTQLISNLITDPVACGDSGCVAGDTTEPLLQSFSSDTPTGVLYGPGDQIHIIANFNEDIDSESSMTVVLNNGVSVTLDDVSGSTLSGVYTIGVTHSGEDSADLAVSSIASQSVKDISYNPLTDITMPETNIDSTGAPYTIDTTAPTLTLVGDGIASPTSDTTPSFTLGCDESGVIALSLSGACHTATTTIGGGDNIITLDADGVGAALADGTYSGCQITVTDEQGNVSSSLTIPDFVVDASGPVLQGFSTTTADGTYGPGAILNLVATYNETLADGSVVSVLLNNGQSVTLNTISLSTLSGNYSVGATGSGQDVADLGIAAVVSQNAQDTLGNANVSTDFSGTDLSRVANLAIDTTAPILSETTPVQTPTSDSTPNYAFYSDSTGVMSYGGPCSGNLTVADAGTNRVTFDTGFGELPDGNYASCTLAVTDAAGNTSVALGVSSFTILTTDSDEDGFLDLVECPTALPLDDTCLDTDGDGEPNYLDTDSDDDGVSEEREVHDGTNPYDFASVLDTDHDGVPDAVEDDEGTDPESYDSVLDSDEDGYSDYLENQDGSDPEDANSLPTDSDADGVSDVTEEQQGTDPGDAASKKDTDADGVPDAVEVRQGSDPEDATNFQDTDGDGIPDYTDTSDDSTPPDSGDDDDTPPADTGDDDTPPADDGGTEPPPATDDGAEEPTTPDDSGSGDDDTDPSNNPGSDTGDDDDTPSENPDKAGGGGCSLHTQAMPQMVEFWGFTGAILLIFALKKCHSRRHEKN